MPQFSEPPAEFGPDSFDWLLSVAEQLEVNFVEGPGLSSDDVDWLETQVRMPMPSDLRLFYRWCSPWSIWREPREQWTRIRDEIVAVDDILRHLVPLDINSQTGNCCVAEIRDDGTYRICDTSQYTLRRRRDVTLRTYLAGEAEDEIQYAAQSDSV